MTARSDDSSSLDQVPTADTPDAGDETARAVESKRARGTNGVGDVAAAPVTRELSTAAAGPDAQGPSGARFGAGTSAANDNEFDDGATREVSAVSADTPFPPHAPATAETAATQGIDPDATIMRAQPRPPAAELDEPMTEPAPPRPRYNTLAGAFNRSRTSATDPGWQSGRARTPAPPLPTPQTPAPQMAAPSDPFADEDFVDEVDETENEWALADQPTVQWTPEQIRQMQRLKPDFLQTGEQPSWPPRPGSEPITPEVDASHHDWRVGLPPRPRPPFPMNGVARPLAGEPRLATPTGRLAPPPPSASVAGAQPDPRMARFQELRRQRFAHGQGERTETDPAPMADTVRQWWNDLRPALESALHYQREARASGMHPIPAYESTAVSRMGDAFGRLAASARELTERAQHAAAPTIKRIHDQVEQAAQGIISRFEGDTVRQQAPLLGPGRIAIFFRQGVSVGQAQRLLAASAARPMRLIPRKHGFLARVQPGKEAEVCERLRMHPYVSDVVYLEFNEYGEPVGGRR